MTKIFLKIRENIPTKPIKVNIESTGIAQGKPVLFDNTDQREIAEKGLWKRNEEAQISITNDPPVITVSWYYANDLHKDSTIPNIAKLLKTSRILIEKKFRSKIFKIQTLTVGTTIRRTTFIK